MEEYLSAIYRYSLVGRNGDFISFHRLVQDVIRTQLPKDKAAQWIDIAVQIMKMGFPYDEYDVKTWATCSQLLPHALATASYAEKFNTGLEEAAEVYQKVGEYLQDQAEYQRAGRAIEHAINIRQEILGGKHEKLAISLNYLGEIRQKQANFVEARKLYSQAFEIFQAESNLETQQFARNLYDLGSLFQDQGEYENARKYDEEALRIRRRILGENHPYTAMSLDGLGVLYQDQGELDTARKYHEQALFISRTALGENHPNVAICLGNLGAALKDQGEFETAAAGLVHRPRRELFRRLRQLLPSRRFVSKAR